MLRLILSPKIRLGWKGLRWCYALNLKTGKVEIFRAKHVVIASGGASKVYQYASNPDTASGDGITVLLARWLQSENLEFQSVSSYMPFSPHAKSFLISESLRGRSAPLVTKWRALHAQIRRTERAARREIL